VGERLMALQKDLSPAFFMGTPNSVVLFISFFIFKMVPDRLIFVKLNYFS
jgi:hypothetical protein